MATLEKPMLDRDAPLPLYRQVEEWLRNQIARGVWKTGDILPSVKSLCEQLDGINHLTVRQAMKGLVREGLLYSIQGRGTFVSEREIKPLRIALVLPNLDDEFTREIAHGVQEVLDGERLSCEDGGATLPCATTVVLDSRRNAQKEDDNIGALEDMALDGAVIFPLAFGRIAERLLQLKLDRFPFVLVDGAVPGLDFDSVRGDHYKGAYELTRHLLEGGRRRLAWVGNLSGYFSAHERYEGYRDALNDFGLPCDRKSVFALKVESPTAPFTDALEDILKQMIAAPMLPDAIICGSDLEALAWLEMLKNRSIKVPGQIAVVGFDDHSEAARSVPSLTTARQPVREIGRQAARLMLERVSQPLEKPKQIVLPVTLVVRHSSAAS